MNISRRLFFALLTGSLLLCLFSCGNNGRDHATLPVATAEQPCPPMSGISEDDPALPQKQVLSFLAAGDNIIHASVFADAAERAKGTDAAYEFASMYQNIAPLIAEADIAFVNQEGPIAGSDFPAAGHPNFNAPEEAGQTLVALGFDVVNIANNHMLDMDTRYRGTGYRNSVAFWKKQDVLMIGGYENQTDFDTVRILEKNGISIAFLSYTYSTNGLTLNAGSPDMVVPLIRDADIKRHIAAAREQADLVFVSMHWGTEGSFTPSAEQKRLSQLIADCGADAIIGHHSHTLQPIEWLTGESGNRTLCIYSLGNLLSTMQNSYYMVGGLVGFDIVKDADGCRIEAPYLTPIVCHYNADPSIKDSQGLPFRDGLNIYLLKDYTEALAKEHGSQLYGAFTLDTLRSYVTDTVDAEFIADFLR